jgi:hypothetical protein
MPRGFLAHQLVSVEDELASCSFVADRLGMEIGEHSDEIHWDKATALPADGWLQEVVECRRKLERAEGLLRAYNLQLAANKGGTDDNASAR